MVDNAEGVYGDKCRLDASETEIHPEHLCLLRGGGGGDEGDDDDGCAPPCKPLWPPQAGGGCWHVDASLWISLAFILG